MSALTIGVDVGGTKVLGGVVDSSGKIIERSRRDTPIQGGADLTQVIADVAIELSKSIMFLQLEFRLLALFRQIAKHYLQLQTLQIGIMCR